VVKEEEEEVDDSKCVMRDWVVGFVSLYMCMPRVMLGLGRGDANAIFVIFELHRVIVSGL
jgi:hypothetical protein